LITDDFTVFQSILEVTKYRNIDVQVLSFSDSIPSHVGVIITSPGELSNIGFDQEKIVIFGGDPNSTVNAALRILDGKKTTGQIVIGIDPGKNPGIAVLEDNRVIEVYHTPARDVPGLVRHILEEYPDENSIVRIGNGARLIGTQLINSILELGVNIELVDETGTSPAVGRGVHGSQISDIIAAINIAGIQGTIVGRQEVEPSMGEIKRIQEFSREHSNGKASIPRDLARKVAKGELTMAEAIEMHEHPQTV
jgi:hypothetical protein